MVKFYSSNDGRLIGMDIIYLKKNIICLVNGSIEK